MKKLVSGIVVTVFVLISSFAQATLIEISANSSVSPGVKAFSSVPVPGFNSGFPTPFYDVPQAPAASNNFTMIDEVRVATQLDLTQIVLGVNATDPLSDLSGGHFGSNFLDWTYVIEALFDSSISYTGHVGYGWSNVKAAQDGGLLQVNFVSNDFFANNIMTRGDWKVTSFLEGNELSTTQFSVPEPAPLALLALGLFAVGYRRAKHSKV